jgi:hypothetical protein
MRVLHIQRGKERQKIVTYLTAEETERLRGVPPEAVVGFILLDESMQVNAVFREFLQETIGRVGALDPDMQKAAASQADGRLVFVDSRVPEEIRPVPEENILGWFQIRGGRIVANSYLPNPHHEIQNSYGLTAAVGHVREAMVAELIDREGV